MISMPRLALIGRAGEKVNHMGMQVRVKAHRKGKRVRIPHNAVAVLAERSSDATGGDAGKAGAALNA